MADVFISDPLKGLMVAFIPTILITVLFMIRILHELIYHQFYEDTLLNDLMEDPSGFFNIDQKLLEKFHVISNDGSNLT